MMIYTTNRNNGLQQAVCQKPGANSWLGFWPACSSPRSSFPQRILGRRQRAKTGQVVAGVVQESGEDMEKLNRIISEHEKLLQKYPDNDFTPTVLLQLAQLYQRQATALFQQQMDNYEKELQAYERNEILEEPALPRANMEKAISHLERLVENYPKASFRDKALYMLGMAYLQQGNRVRAQLSLEQIISEFPRSAITLESHFRIAEFYFDRREYSQAIDHYKTLLDQWDNPYFDMALYKLGWSYYSLGDYPHAITSFIYLLEDMALIERTNSQQLSRSKADLSSEAIQYIASCYAEYGGPAAAQNFFASRTEKSYTLPILVQLAGLYQKRNYYPEAIAAQEVLLTLYPFYENAPEILKQMVDNFEADGRRPQAIQTRERIVQQFSPGGFWLIEHASGPVHHKADSLARVTLRGLGAYYQSEGQRSGRLRDHQIAIEKYEDYLAEVCRCCRRGRDPIFPRRVQLCQSGLCRRDRGLYSGAYPIRYHTLPPRRRLQPGALPLPAPWQRQSRRFLDGCYPELHRQHRHFAPDCLASFRKRLAACRQ